MQAKGLAANRSVGTHSRAFILSPLQVAKAVLDAPDRVASAAEFENVEDALGQHIERVEDFGERQDAGAENGWRIGRVGGLVLQVGGYDLGGQAVDGGYDILAVIGIVAHVQVGAEGGGS